MDLTKELCSMCHEVGTMCVVDEDDAADRHRTTIRCEHCGAVLDVEVRKPRP